MCSRRCRRERGRPVFHGQDACCWPNSAIPPHTGTRRSVCGEKPAVILVSVRREAGSVRHMRLLSCMINGSLPTSASVYMYDRKKHKCTKDTTDTIINVYDVCAPINSPPLSWAGHHLNWVRQSNNPLSYLHYTRRRHSYQYTNENCISCQVSLKSVNFTLCFRENATSSALPSAITGFLFTVDKQVAVPVPASSLEPSDIISEIISNKTAPDCTCVWCTI